MFEIDAAVARLEAVQEEGFEYLEFHRPRYRFLLGVVDDLLRKAPHGARILDIGPSYQTGLVQQLRPDAAMDTLGYFDYRFPFLQLDRHIPYDLNLAAEEGSWPRTEPYDLVLMAEVIEHLHIAPYYALRFVRNLVRPGGTLVLQTPNAVALGKRTAMLFGRNPHEPIREDARNPGHFCEYTLADLKQVAVRSGWRVEGEYLANYFGRRGWRKTLYSLACSVLPGELEDGITLVLRRHK